MNKFIIGALVIAVIGIVTVSVMSNNQEDQVKEQVISAITVASSSHNFGDIDIFGGKVETTYTLLNEGQEDVAILSAVTSCMCTEGEIGGLRFGMHESSDKIVIIPAGEEKILTAIYDPLAHGPDGTGRVKRELLLKTNSSATPEIKVVFTANVTKEN